MTRSLKRILLSTGLVALGVTALTLGGAFSRPAAPAALDTAERIDSVSEVAGKPVETVTVDGRKTKAAAGHLVVVIEDAAAKARFGDRLTPTTIPDTYLLAIDGPVEAERQRVAALPGVERAAPDYVVTATRTPDDPQYATHQWNLSKISAPQAWDRTVGDDSALVADIDTGVNRNHQDLAARMWTNEEEIPGNDLDDDDNGYIDDDTGMDFVHATQPGGVFKNDANGPLDDHGHGTLTASVTGAATDNATGIAGVDWRAKVVAVKVLDEDGFGLFSDVAEGIRYASIVGAEAANLSLGAFGVSSDFMTDEAIEFATDRGTVVIAASGNDGSASIVDYPAKHPDAIAVGATTSTDARAGYSNGGAELDLVAPGSGIRGAGLGSTSYINASGTSLSTPEVTGVVSLLKSMKPELTTAEAREILHESADKVSGMGGANRTNGYGYGRLNAKRALDQVKPYSAQWAGQSAPPAVSSGEDSSVYVDFKNNGTQAWSNTGANPVRLGTSHPRDRQSPFYNSTWLAPNRVGTFTGRLEAGGDVTTTDTIEPGETARFVFTMTAPPRSSAVNLREYFQPVVESITWLEDWGVYLEASVPARTYAYQYVGQTSLTGVMQPNERQEVTIDLENTGTATWRNDTLYDFKLATSHARDRSSGAYNDTWQAPNRAGAFKGTVAVGILTETNQVEPGETARFSFDIKAPSGGTNHKEYFQPVVERFGWLNDIGIYWPVVVPSKPYDYAYVSQTGLGGVLEQGETGTLKLRLRNTGFSDWESAGGTPFRIGTDRPRDRASGFADGGSAAGWSGTNRVKLTRNLTDPAKDVGGETTVAPGETGEFEFEVVANPAPGTYKEYFRPVADGVGWLKDIGIYWSVGVSHPIDVGLAQQSTATFTSNGTVTIRDVLGAVRGTAAAGQTVTLRHTGTSYQAVLPSGTITSCCALTAEQGASNVFTVSNLADGGSNNRFRGAFSVRNGNVGAWLVNTINLEEYMRGLGEVPDSWPIESIKAQVVAARTYAARKIEAPKTNIFDLYDDTRDQVYRGYNREIIQPNHVSATNATKGKVVKRSGALIQAFYSSNAAGFTASNEEVWGGSPINYLRGKADSYSLASDTDHLWPDTTARATIKANYGYGCTVTGVSIPAKYVSGRMKTVRLSGSGCATKDYTLAADTHRSRLGLPSSQVTGVSKSGTNFVFAGKGFGHGIGMSQWGANRRAAEGQSYSTILGFYYTGVSIGNLY